MDILKKLLYLLLFTFPLGVVIRIPIFTSAFIYPIDIILFLILIAQSILVYTLKKPIYSLSIFKPLALFIFFAFLSLVINISHLKLEQFAVAFLYLVRFTFYAQLLFVFIYFDRAFSKKYLFFLAISGFVTVVLGFVQYVLFPYLGKLYYLGWDEHYFRIFTTFLDPNFAGALFILLLLLLMYLFIINYSKKNITKYILGISLFLTICAIFLTYSRSSFLMLLTSCITYIILIKRKKIVLLFLLIFVFGVILIPKNLSSEGVDLLRTASILQREEAYQHALDIFSDSPIYGVGFNAYRYAQKEQGFLEERNWESSHSGAGVPNSFLFALATTGVIGFLLFMNFWWTIFKSLFTYKNYSSSEAKAESRSNGSRQARTITYFKPLVISSIVGIFVHSLFENTLFYPFVMMWIFILIGVVMAGKKL